MEINDNIDIGGVPIYIKHESCLSSIYTECYTYKVPEEAPLFVFHFPENPILPGAVIIHLALKAMNEAYPQDVLYLSGARIATAVRPGDLLIFKISTKDKSIALRCNIFVSKDGKDSPIGSVHAQL